MLPIQFMPIKYNFNAGGNSVKYIVIHDTGNPTASALNHFKYFNGGNRGASAHYFVDEANIIQLIKDSDRAWHTARSSSNSNCGAGNDNSIGIEICLPGNRDKSVAHTIDLTVHLMKKYNVPLNRLVRHYDCSGKSCPNFMKPNNWAKWIEFKALVANRLAGDDGMQESDVKKIVAEEIEKAMKPSKAGAGMDDKHWAYKSVVDLNKHGLEISELRLNDAITRGEVFAIVQRLINSKKL